MSSNNTNEGNLRGIFSSNSEKKPMNPFIENFRGHYCKSVPLSTKDPCFQYPGGFLLRFRKIFAESSKQLQITMFLKEFVPLKVPLGA